MNKYPNFIEYKYLVNVTISKFERVMKIIINFRILLMKKLIGLLIFISLFSSVRSQNDTHVKGIPEKVTVFQSGANLSMSIKVNVKKGTNTIYIDSMPASIDPNSIRLYAGSSAAVMSTDFTLEKITSENQTEPNNIISVRDSIKKLNYLSRDLSNQISVLQGEEGIIASYKLHPETEKGSSIQELTTLANYYNKRINEIRKEILNHQEKQNEYSILIAKLNKQISDYELTKQPVQNYQIVATLSSEIEGSINLELNVFTPSAGWQPNYEIKVNDVESPVKLSYKALVWQETSKDWTNVKLFLSTRNPNISNNIPVLTPWYLKIIYSSPDLDSPMMPTSSNSVRSSRSKELSMVVDGMESGTIDNKYMTVEYSPTNKYTIKSDKRKQSITLNDVNVPAVYEYYCAPKLDPDAFLIAKVPDWGKLNLLPGEAYIYFENTYIGKTKINPESTLDSLSISLGRDKSIVLKREIIQNMTETKFFSSNVVKQNGFMITVKNNRKSDINITIEDQFPVTTHEKIEVELLETSGAKIDKEKGFLKWLVKIPAGKSIERKFGYKIDKPQ